MACWSGFVNVTTVRPVNRAGLNNFDPQEWIFQADTQPSGGCDNSRESVSRLDSL
jgi:hypothetical protein